MVNYKNLIFSITSIGVLTSCFCKFKYKTENGLYIVNSDFFKLNIKGRSVTMLDNVKFKPLYTVGYEGKKNYNIGGMGYLIFYKDGKYINYYNEKEDLSKVPTNSIYYGRYFIEKDEITMEKVRMNQPPSKCYSREIIKGKIIDKSLVLFNINFERYYLKD